MLRTQKGLYPLLMTGIIMIGLDPSYALAELRSLSESGETIVMDGDTIRIIGSPGEKSDKNRPSENKTRYSGHDPAEEGKDADAVAYEEMLKAEKKLADKNKGNLYDQKKKKRRQNRAQRRKDYRDKAAWKRYRNTLSRQ